MDRLVIVSSFNSEIFYFELAWDTCTESSKVGWVVLENAADRWKIYLSGTYVIKTYKRHRFYIFQSTKLVHALVFLKKLLILKMKIYHDVFE